MQVAGGTRERWRNPALAAELGKVCCHNLCLQCASPVQKFRADQRIPSASWKTSCCVEQVDDWDAFDVFKVASLTGDRPLEPIMLAVLQHFDLIDKLRLPDKKLRNYLRVCASLLHCNLTAHGASRGVWLSAFLGMISSPRATGIACAMRRATGDT